MPPKAEAGSGSEAFLAACVKCAKAKLEVDFDAVAKATGMSKGGASNKFRAIMKQFEDEGAPWTSNSTGNRSTSATVAVKRKATPKKNATPLSEAKITGGDTDEEEKPTAKKCKTGKAAPKKKGTAMASEKKQKQATEANASEGEVNEDEQTGASEEEA